MKTHIIEDEFFKTMISKHIERTSMYCDVTLEPSVALIRIVAKNKTGGEENRIDLSLKGIKILASLIE